jgi:CheY-specific phosphatase CheX
MSHSIVEQAAREVLETTAATKVRRANRRLPDGTFSGFIATLSLSGTRGGTLVVYCRRELAAAMAAGMLGPGGDAAPEETLQDALGELVNQIGGTIKRKLAASGAEMMLSVPVVVAGGPLSHVVKSKAPPLAVDLELEGGNCCVCLWPAQ